jgi:hypothetical protein
LLRNSGARTSKKTRFRTEISVRLRRPRAIEFVRSVFLHPALALILGVILTFVAHASIVFRSYALIVIGAWLTLDVWLWIFDDRWRAHILGRYRIAIGGTLSCLIFIAVMGGMYYMLIEQLSNEQDDLQQHVTAEIALPPSGDPLTSVFTLTNNSRYDMDQHDVSCHINVVRWSGQPPITNLAIVTLPASTNVRLGPNGDKWSGSCPNLVPAAATTLDCADITFKVQYALADQPERLESKSFRFFTRRSGTTYAWYGEPVASPAAAACSSHQ